MNIVIPGIPFPVSTCIHYRDTISPGLKRAVSIQDSIPAVPEIKTRLFSATTAGIFFIDKNKKFCVQYIFMPHRSIIERGVFREYVHLSKLWKKHAGRKIL